MQRFVVFLLLLFAVSAPLVASKRTICNKDSCTWLSSSLRNATLTPEYAPQGQFHPKEDELHVFCYKGQAPFSSKAIFLLWSVVEIKIVASSDSFEVLYGNSSSAIAAEKKIRDSKWLPTTPWESKSQMRIVLTPFGNSCFGIVFTVSKETYYLVTTIQVIHWKFPLLFLLGVILFFAAEHLSSNAAFFYTTGVTAGTLASILLIVYVLSRFVPGKSSAYAVLLGGWSLCAYFFRWTFDHMREIVLEYPTYVAAYFLLAATISFAICYYIGPPTEKRRQNLVKWALQFVALLLLYMSTQLRESSATVIVIILSIYCLPPSVYSKFKSYWLRMFPHKIKLLSPEEYERQGVQETQRALEELRRTCKSNDFNAWETVQRLKHPENFARFISGHDHVSSEEVEAHSSFDENVYSETEKESEDENVNNN